MKVIIHHFHYKQKEYDNTVYSSTFLVNLCLSFSYDQVQMPPRTAIEFSLK